MSLPGQMYDHMLNADKGWPSQTALDYAAKISANVLYDLTAGQVCHLNASGELEPGVVRWQMPLFIFQGKNDLDVNNSNNGEWYPISPSGRVMCLVGKGPFELWTTEFDSDLTYAPNEPLIAPTGNAAIDVHDGGGTESGRLTNNITYTIADTIASSGNKWQAVCGIVSKGKFTNAYGKTVLAFWPVWFPGHPTQ